MADTPISRLLQAHTAVQECLWSVRPDELASLVPAHIEPALTKSGKSFSAWIADLIKAAEKSSHTPYCDYSHYGLGSSVLAFDGRRLKIYGGANFENCAYTPTVHAEVAAVVNAQSAGCLTRARKRGFSKTQWLIALACHDPQDILNPIPCSVCRQYLVEFGRDLIIVGPGPQSDLVNATTLKIITPGAFVPDMVTPFLPKQ
jgi:cytidine deaminase